MKLDAKALRYLSKDDWRTLVAVEMGMKNHEYVPVPLICSISNLKFGGSKKALKNIHKFKLLFHDGKKYDGYKLTYLGYDFLALRALVSRETISYVGNQIGVGKESDVYIVADDQDQEYVLKLHRLGRVSFKTVKNNRDYLKHRKSASWLYLSRLAAMKEFAYMKALYDNGFPVPKPIDVNRHCIVMGRVRGYPLLQVIELRHPSKVYSDLMSLIVRLANYGLIHGDFNEFNILISDEEEVTLIDFPQMISTSHLNAEYYFDRDVQCIRTFFEKRYGFIGQSWPVFADYKEKVENLDVLVHASGFTREMQKDMEQLTTEQNSDDEDDVNGEEDGNTENTTNNNNTEEEEEDEEEESSEESSSESEDEGESKYKKRKALQKINKNTSFKFSDLKDTEEAPILLRKEFIDEMKALDLNDDDDETIPNTTAETTTTPSTTTTSTSQPVVDGEKTPEQIEHERLLELYRKAEEQKFIQQKVKKALEKQGKGKMVARNTSKSSSKKEIKSHIKSYS